MYREKESELKMFCDRIDIKKKKNSQLTDIVNFVCVDYSRIDNAH